MKSRFIVSLGISSLKYLTVFQSSFQQQQQEFVFEGHLNESFRAKSLQISSNERREENAYLVCLCTPVSIFSQAFLSS
jgi:hypothetical protein